MNGEDSDKSDYKDWMNSVWRGMFRFLLANKGWIRYKYDIIFRNI